MPRLDQLLEMLAREPHDSFLRYALGMEYMKTQDWPKAIEAFQEVITRDPDYVAAYFMGGRAQQHLGDKTAAKATYTQGVEVAKKVGDSKAVREIGDALALLS